MIMITLSLVNLRNMKIIFIHIIIHPCTGKDHFNQTNKNTTTKYIVTVCCFRLVTVLWKIFGQCNRRDINNFK